MNANMNEPLTKGWLEEQKGVRSLTRLLALLSFVFSVGFGLFALFGPIERMDTALKLSLGFGGTGMAAKFGGRFAESFGIQRRR